MNNGIITEKQARQITGGRKPLVPIEYEQACTSLAACLTIDDAKYWSDKSDALAAWAKIYHDDQASTDARRVKLKAYRRMGELARELRPTRKPSANKLLREHGIDQHHARVALSLSLAPEKEFSKVVERAPGLHKAALQFRGLGARAGKTVSTDAWVWLASGKINGGSLYSVRTAFRQRAARDIAAQISQGEVKVARELVREIVDWLEEFEAALPKSPSA
jgi:hypothetical protein